MVSGPYNLAREGRAEVTISDVGTGRGRAKMDLKVRWPGDILWYGVQEAQVGQSDLSYL